MEKRQLMSLIVSVSPGSGIAKLGKLQTLWYDYTLGAKSCMILPCVVQEHKWYD